MKTIAIPPNQSQTILDTGGKIMVKMTNKTNDQQNKNRIKKQLNNETIKQYNNITINLSQDSTVEYYFLYQNHTIERNIIFNLNAPGASAKLIGLFYLGTNIPSFRPSDDEGGEEEKSQIKVLEFKETISPPVVRQLADSQGRNDNPLTLNLNSQMVHHAPNTYGNTFVKGALSNESKAVLKGMIKIAKGAHGSDDLLTERVLLLSPKARAEADPQLEIDADNVKATHAATISRINQEHMYYLRTRGLPEDQSKHFIVTGFLQEILDMFPKELKTTSSALFFA